MRHDPATLLLYRPVNQAELDLIAAADWLAFPLEQPAPLVFYLAPPEPAADLPDAGSGYLLRLATDADYAAHFEAAGRGPAALCIPATELVRFNYQLVGRIEVVALFPAG